MALSMDRRHYFTTKLLTDAISVFLAGPNDACNGALHRVHEQRHIRHPLQQFGEQFLFA
jgi:hypothetical protein